MLRKPVQHPHAGYLIPRPSIGPRYQASAKTDELCSLDAILKRADRSNSWGYSHGLVPMFDNNGAKIPSKTTPPWPWDVLPDPIIKVGKKQWLTSAIDLWFVQMQARASGLANATSHAGLHGEKSRG